MRSCLALLLVCSFSIAACTLDKKPENRVSNDYQAPVMQVATPANISAICYDARDLAAFRARMVQQVLVVGVLQCKGADGKVHLDDEYKAFIVKFSPELSANAAEMKSLVARKKANLDVIVTEIANRTAQRPLNDPDFCSRHVRAFAWALQPQVTSLKDVPSPYDLGPEMRVFPCPTK
jgi:hypothetical protein